MCILWWVILLSVKLFGAFVVEFKTELKTWIYVQAIDLVVSLLIDVVVLFYFQVDPFLSVSAAHDIGENARQEIHNSHQEIAEVFIHIGMVLDSIICQKWSRERVTQSVSVIA